MIHTGLAYFCATGAFGTTFFLMNVSNQMVSDWLQYGAFGLCVVMVMYLLYYMKTMGDTIREKDKKYIELLERDIDSRNRLSECLKDRKCIADDHRIKG